MISGLANDGEDRRQLMEAGFIPGVEVELIASSFLGGPLAVALHGTRIALRRTEALAIQL